MARIKISEWKAKQLISQEINIPYNGIAIKGEKTIITNIEKLAPNGRFVGKVDQGVKGRFKKRLVVLDATPEELKKSFDDFLEKGYSQFLVEPFVFHDLKDEKYLAIERQRDGYMVWYSKKGGIDIENEPQTVEKTLVSSELTELHTIARFLAIPETLLQNIFRAFDTYYFSFLEINPFIIAENAVYFLDMAVEVDSTADFFVNGDWTSADFIQGIGQKTDEEKQIELLASQSQAAFSFTPLSADGSLCMLLSGGGASVVLADEAKNLGFGKSLLNYGEYSGNPNAEETYQYTKQVLSFMLRSSASKKAIIISGGVANFTDIRITFRGIIKALDEVKTALQKQNLKVFVRRGGPHQEEGLATIRTFLEKNNLLGAVEDPKKVLTDIVLDAINYLKE